MFAYKRAPLCSVTSWLASKHSCKDLTLSSKYQLSTTMTTSVLAVPLDPALKIQGKQAPLVEEEETSVLSEDSYAVNLEKSLMEKIELMIDFSSLKTCLDPQREPVEATSNHGEFDYKEFIYETLDKKPDKFISLQSLVLRKIPLVNPSPPLQQWDQYTQLYHSIFQLSSLTELDLSDNPIHKELQSTLQFWSAHNLKKLVMDNTSLAVFPASVGRLRKLEVLSLAKNKLKDLPVTIRFCESLRVLNLQRNCFKQIPGVVLHLKNLQELKRLDNPLTPRYAMGGPKYTQAKNSTSTNTDKNKEVKFNPHSLQTLCTQTVFSTQVDYWQHTIIGPLQCKTLDRLAATFALCEHCKRAIPNPGEFAVEVLLLTFLELSGVVFLLHVCSKNCQDKVIEAYGKKNVQLQKELDEKYEREIKEAERLVRSNTVDISMETINAPAGTVQPFVPQWPRGTPYVRRRHRKKCAIM